MIWVRTDSMWACLRTSAALGLAVLTATLTRHQAQQMADRAALIPSDVTPPHVGPPGIPAVVKLHAMYQELAQQVFVDAVGDLMVVTAGLTMVAVLLALPLRSHVRQRPARTVATASAAALAEAPQPKPEPELAYAGRHADPASASNGSSEDAAPNGSPEDAAANGRRPIRHR